MSESGADYEDRLTAFVDILGWTHATRNMPASGLLQTLQPIIDRGSFHNEHSRRRAVVEFGDRVNPIMLGVQFAFFSDCFIFSVPTSFQGRIYSMASEMMLPLLKQGFTLRGGVVAGELFHRDNIVFGPALIQAYEIEQKEAKFARILVDHTALDAIEPHEHDALMQDHLGNWVIDPFPWKGTTEEKNKQEMLRRFFDPAAIIRVIEDKLREYESRPRVRDIWRFQAQVCAQSLQKYGPSAASWMKELHDLAV